MRVNAMAARSEKDARARAMDELLPSAELRVRDSDVSAMRPGGVGYGARALRCGFTEGRRRVIALFRKFTP